MRGRLAGGWWACALLAVPAAAHIGSPVTFFEGEAGPYPVRVSIREPGVVPGLAEISIRVREGIAERVAVRPVRWDAGLEGAPPPDPARPIRGEEGLFTAELWLMTAGSYSVYVDVAGPRGSGTAIVPINAVATRRLGMQAGLGWMLAALGVLLFSGAVTIVGAAVRESVAGPGEEPPRARRRAARWAMVATSGFLALALYGGRLWWASSDREHESRLGGLTLDVAMAARLEPAGHRTLELVIEDEEWRQKRWTPLVPDHGKLVHMFVLREPGLDAFAHLHPVRLDHETFAVDLPAALPAGRYRVYADVTHGSGFSHTLTGVVELPGALPQSLPRADEIAPDPDDSWSLGDAMDPGLYVFDNGRRLRWRRPEALVADRELELHFVLETSDGVPVELEPYMGMLSHAAVRRWDGSVFTHLHPTGTFSMAARQLFEEGSFRRGEEAPPADGTAPEAVHTAHVKAAPVGPPAEGVTFPYALPQPGRYRIWVQLKSGATVYTGIFDAEVAPEPPGQRRR